MNESTEDLAIKASDILSVTENYQWELGKISQSFVEKQGFKALPEFSQRIKDIGGVTRSPSSLRMYAYVWQLSDKLGLPKDILFSTCQAIVFSKDPQKYAEMAKNGANRTELYQMIYEDKKK